MMLREGLSYTSHMTVDEKNTAIALGSGDMPVLATPAMTALMENAAMLAVKDAIEEGQTTVGGQIESTHLKPSRIGSNIEATATLEKVDGRKLFFHIVAKHGEITIGEGWHLRFIVDRDKFLCKL